MAALALVGAAAPRDALASGDVERALAAWTRGHPATSALVVRITPTGPVTVASYLPDSARMPASNMKLVTSAGALLALGTEFRFETRLATVPAAAGQGGGRILRGPLYLKGFGDPVLATGPFARRYLGGRAATLTDLARQLHADGVRAVRGPIVADDTFFDRRRTGNGWLSYYPLYSPPLSGLSTNLNYAGEGRWSNVTSPALAAAQRMRAALAAAGIRQTGPLRPGRTPTAATTVASVQSPPLRVILRHMNPDSDNFIAETLAKDVGAYAAGSGSTAAGTAYITRLLRERGIFTGRERLVDGSGLSRNDRLTATGLVRLVLAADADPGWGDALLRSLPQGGEGTLIRRLKGSTVRTRVRAKTGYIDGVSALSGRVISRRGERYAFSFLMRTSQTTAARAAQDRMVTLLAAGRADPA